MHLFGQGNFRSIIHGQARWMGYFEARRFLSRRHDGLVLSGRRRLTLEQSQRNAVLVAATGQGKTSRYIIPNVLLCTGSMVVTDPSGEIFAKTAGHLAARGYALQVLQPHRLHESWRFNPMAYFRGQQGLRRLAHILAGHVSSPSDPFWGTSAAGIMYVCLSALAHDNDGQAHIGNLRLLLNRLGALQDQALHRFLAARLSASLWAQLVAFLAQDERVLANVLSTARAAVDLWTDPDVEALTATNSVDIAALRTRKTAIFLVVPEHLVRYHALWLNLFYAACFEHCLQTGACDDLPVFFFLDEFGNLGRIENFAVIANTLRKRRCSLSIILQDLAQLSVLYGRDEAKAIFSGGMANKLFFSGLDLEACQYLERVLGQTTVFDTSSGEADDHARTVAKPLLRADEIRTMAAEAAILVSSGRRPVRLRMPPYFGVPALRRLTKVPPPRLSPPAAGSPVVLPLDPPSALPEAAA